MNINYISESGDVAISSHSIITNGAEGKAELKSPPKIADVKPSEHEIHQGVAYWGSSNTLPAQMVDDIEHTGILSGAIDAKVRIAIGKGPQPAIVTGRKEDGQEIIEFIRDTPIEDFLELNNIYKYSYDTMRDLFGLGNAWTTLLLNASRTEVLYFKREQAFKGRLGVDTRSGKAVSLLLSGDWEQWTNKDADKSHFKEVPLLDRDFPYLDLISRTKGHVFALALQYTLSGRDWYAPSPWWAARQWVKIARGVPSKKEAIYDNQMNIKYLINVNPQYWKYTYPDWDTMTAAKKKEAKTEFYKKIEENLTGGENSGKSIWNTQYFDNEKNDYVDALKIEVIDDKIKEGQLLPDSNAAVIEILIALQMNPSLFGAEFGSNDAYGGGAGSGSNIREAYLIQLMLIENERRITNTVFDIAKRVNGWAEKYKEKGQLVLRYPNQILTTLNTGAATKDIN